MLPAYPALSLKNRMFRRVVILGILTFLSLYLIWIIWGHKGSQERYLVGNLSLVFTGLAATFLAFEVRRLLEKTKEGQLNQVQVWNWLGGGLALWTLGDLVRMFLERLAPQSILSFVPLDIIYLDGSLAVLIGMLMMPRKPRENVGPVRLLLDLTITNVAIISVAWLAIFQPAYQSTGAGSGTPVALLYPAVDLILLLVLVNLFLMSQPGSLLITYGWIGMALAAYTISDLAYAYLVINGEYHSGSIMGFGWAAGDCMMIFAAIYQLENIDQKRKTFPFSLLARARLQSLLPLLATLVMGGYTIFNWQPNSQLAQLGSWVTAVLGIGLIARQLIVAGEVEFQQYASLVNSVAEPTFVCDRRGLLRLANPALLFALGAQDPNSTISKPLSEIVVLPQSMEQVLAQAIEHGWSGESLLRRTDGTQIPVTLALRPIDAGNDHNLALAGTAHDLSEYKRQQAAIQQAYEQVDRAREALELLNTQLEEKVAGKTASLSEAYEQLEEQNRKLQTLDQMKSDFVSLVSHELRAPLTNINGGIELVLSQPYPFPRRVRSTLDLVQAEIQRLTRFVETILDLSALEAGRTPIYPAPIHLETIVTRLKNQMRHLSDAGRVRWQIPTELPFLMADEQALTSILFHLLDNAMKYAPEGEIVVSAGVQTKRAWVQVSDEGPGIASEALPFLFMRFYRSRTSDSQTVYGHGLGLYIVHRLIQAMEGEIQVMNRPQGGACFTCWLPVITMSDQTIYESDGFLPAQMIEIPPLDLD
jgi:PAS domain S-box-containing protein